MFNEDKNNKDLTSPIFDNNNKEIGYSFKYEPNIKDYTPYIINNEYKAMIKLFFHYTKFHSKSISFNNGKYYLIINSQYIKKYKDYYSYSKLEEDLSKNKIVLQVLQNIKENHEYIIDDKIMTLIIKSLPNDFNKKFFEKSKYNVQTGNIPEEPIIKNVQNTNLLYYNDFELIDKHLYYFLFKKNNLGLYGECYFKNNNICIKMPKDLNKKLNTEIYIYGYLNSQHNFKEKYLFEYNTENDFIKNFNDLNIKDGFDNYINSFKFSNNNLEQIVDINNNQIGLIYNLSPDFNNINSSIIFNDISKEFSMPPLIGLKNVESFSYMNAILQCLCQIKKIVTYFKYNKNVEQIIKNNDDINRLSLTKSFKNIIENLWPSNNYFLDTKNTGRNNNNEFYIPYDIKNKIISMNSLFNSNDKHEPQNLIYFIIMKLHEELNKKNKNNNFNLINNDLDQSNQQLMFSNFFQQFANDNASIISDIFYWTNQTIIQCMNCGIKKYNLQMSSYLLFPLEEVYNHKRNQLAKNINNKLISIYDCFKYYQRIETLAGENALPCDICKLKCSSTYMSLIYTPPEIFILILDRSKFPQIKLEFYEDINLTNYISENDVGSIYRLFAIVSESDGINSHFLAYCKNPINHCWYKYDDEYVSIVNNFKNEIIDSNNPYILFYQKIT